MKRFSVSGSVRVDFNVEVDAESEDAADKIVKETWTASELLEYAEREEEVEIDDVREVPQIVPLEPAAKGQ